MSYCYFAAWCWCSNMSCAKHDLSLVSIFSFLAALGISILIAVKRYERKWYGARAVAESVKTATWRYMMRADPFLDAASISDANKKFTDLLVEILRSNNQIGEILSGQSCTNDQITSSMMQIRSQSLTDRKAFYLQERIDDQLVWYEKKSKQNKRKGSIFFGLLIFVQSIIIALMITKVVAPSFLDIWPVSMLVVAASSITVWMQLKRFREISSAYALTANEIGIIKTKLQYSNTDSDFSDFVRDAENAFSREHTQWIAKTEDSVSPHIP